MPEIKKVVGYNLLLLFMYSIAIHLNFTGYEYDRDILILGFSAFAVGIQVIINILISLINFSSGNKVYGKAFLLSSGFVLLIGYSLCIGNARF